MMGLRISFAMGMIALSIAAAAIPALAASGPASATAPRENLNCNDPAVSKGAGSWKPSKSQLQAFDNKLVKVAFPSVALHAGIPANVHYGLLHCGIHENGAAVIVVDGVHSLHGKFLCDDEVNFAVAYDPAKQSFGTFHLAIYLCPPSTARAPKAP